MFAWLPIRAVDGARRRVGDNRYPRHESDRALAVLQPQSLSEAGHVARQELEDRLNTLPLFVKV